MILVAWLGALATAGPCDDATSVHELSRQILEGERALRASDREALDVAEAAATEVMRCLDEPLLPRDAAAYLRLQGTARFVRRDRDNAARSFAAARSVDPAWALPLDLVPDPHPLREAFHDAGLATFETASLPAPAWGWVEVNGRRTTRVPLAHPWVLQWRDAQGQVLITAAGDGHPDALPYTVERTRATAQAPEVRRPAVWTALVGQVGPQALRGGVAFGATGPLSRRIDAEVAVQGLVGTTSADAGTGALLLPDVRAGARVWLSDRPVKPYVGASAVLFGEPERPLGLGALVGAGLRVGARQFVEADVRAGIRRELMVQAGVALGWWLPGR